MAALLVFVVFLVAIVLSIPIGVSMILGSVAPILMMARGGVIPQIVDNTLSGANSTPSLTSSHTLWEDSRAEFPAQ